MEIVENIQSNHKEQNSIALENSHESIVFPEDQGVLASLGLNPQLFIFQFINFAIVALVIWFLILKPLVKQMDERKKIVDESIDNAKAIKIKLEDTQKISNDKIIKANEDANKIIEKAHADAVLLLEKSSIETQQHITEMFIKSRKEIIEEREKMIIELKHETLLLITSVSQKFLEKKINQDSDTTLIKQILEKI